MQFLFSDVFRSKLLEELYRNPWNQISPPSFVALHCLECVILTEGAEWCFSKSKDLGLSGSCSNLKSEKRACDTVVIQHILAYKLSCPSYCAFYCPLSVRKFCCTLLCWPQSFYFSQISPVLMLIVHLNPQVSELPLSLQMIFLHPSSVFCISRHIPWAALKHIWVSLLQSTGGGRVQQGPGFSQHQPYVEGPALGDQNSSLTISRASIELWPWITHTGVCFSPKCMQLLCCRKSHGCRGQRRLSAV